MKIGILSDTHMIKDCIDKTIPYLKECDLIIHAGDNFSDSKYIHNMTKVGIMAVKGNCDFDNVEDELIFDVEDKVINLFDVVTDPITDARMFIEGSLDNKLIQVTLWSDIVIFGHTHTPLNLKKDNIIYINPGSVSLPRGVDYKSFSIINLENNNIRIERIRL